MTIKENISLLPYNTFGIDVKARLFIEYYSLDELRQVLREHKGEPILHIGQGSNLLFTQDFDGVILHSGMARAKFLDDNTVEAQNGLRLDDMIAQLTDMGYCGLEKLSLIPGEVGASAVQNVGAYGVEAKDVIDRVYTLDVETLEERVFTNAECKFGYRDSIFKHELKGKYIVTSVVYKVKPGEASKTREEIIATRNGKLPKVGEVGSAGSFFMNPFVPEAARCQDPCRMAHRTVRLEGQDHRRRTGMAQTTPCHRQCQPRVCPRHHGPCRPSQRQRQREIWY